MGIDTQLPIASRKVAPGAGAWIENENSYLALDGENVVVFEEKQEIGRLPLHNLEGIVSFGYRAYHMP